MSRDGNRLQSDREAVQWRLHLRSSPSEAFRFLSTDDGRARFWAEEAVERDGVVHFRFPNGQTWEGAIVRSVPDRVFAVRYIGGSVATFTLEDDGQGGTDLTLTDEGVSEDERVEVLSGWVSVLLSMKAAIDFGVDLRAHDPRRHWDHGFVEN